MRRLGQDDPALRDSEAWEQAYRMSRFGFRPDAWRIEPDTKVVTLVEVEVTSHIKEAKWMRVAEFFWWLDIVPWHLRLELIDRRGGVFLVDVTLVALAYLFAEDDERHHEWTDLLDNLPGRHAPTAGPLFLAAGDHTSPCVTFPTSVTGSV